MPEIRVVNLHKEFKEVVAVDKLTFNFPNSKVTCLLGPSGCGKTTLLRMIAGLEIPTSGDVYFDDLRVTDLPTCKRDIGMIFQYAVVYHGIDVYHNIELPLLSYRISAEERKKRISNVIELLELQDCRKKYVDELDNLSRQKVAVAREVARKPKIILFDEPITDVDANSKQQFKCAFKELTKYLEQTIIYVTHDQTEAMTLADHIALMNDGRITQCELPRTLYNQPEDIFGGWFLGNPGMNYFKHNCEKQNGSIVVKSSQFSTPLHICEAANIQDEVIIGIRPENINVFEKPSNRAVKGEVVSKTITIGGQYLITLRIGNEKLKAKVESQKGCSLEKQAWVELPIKKVILFSKDGRRIHAKLLLEA